ncbi:MAG: FG-GAP-like repeat-containing protein [Acetobacteraceae bacterium]|nr:FG-GAP-like repeat-containing protein [Acetobacteraceae bacterium]
MSASITFSEFANGTSNPVFVLANNIVRTQGFITTDSWTPTSPVLSGVPRFDGPISLFFDRPVTTVSLTAGYFDNTNSTVIQFLGPSGQVLSSVRNAGLAIGSFSFSDNNVGIASVVARIVSTEAAGFAIDNVTLGAPVRSKSVTLDPAVVQLAERNIGTLDLASVGSLFTDTLGAPNDPLDTFGFKLERAADVTFGVWTSANKSDFKTVVGTYGKGDRVFGVRPDDPFATGITYSVQILDIKSIDASIDAQLEALQRKYKGLDLAKVPFEYMEETFNIISKMNLEDVPKFLSSVKATLKWGGYAFDALTSTAEVYQVAQAGGNWKRALAGEVGGTLVGMGFSAGVLTLSAAALPGPYKVLAPLFGVGGALVYELAVSDSVEATFEAAYDAATNQPRDMMPRNVITVPTPVAFDASWYLATYADAREAVAGGRYQLAQFHYLGEGAAKGYRPSATGTVPLDRLIAAGNTAWADTNAPSAWLQNLTITLSGDGRSAPETDIVTAINADRPRALAGNAALDMLANRVAAQLADLGANRIALAPGANDDALDNLLNTTDIVALLNAAQTRVNVGTVSFALVDGFETTAQAIEALRVRPGSWVNIQTLDDTQIGVAVQGPVVVVVTGDPRSATVAPVAEAAFRFAFRGDGAAELIGGSPSGDSLLAEGGNDVVRGGGGDDVVQGGSGDDSLDGGAGNDTASYIDAPGLVTVDLSVTAPQNTISAGIDILAGLENLVGSAFNDILAGNAAPNTLFGGLGDDTLTGAGGNDVLFGSIGIDTALFSGPRSSYSIAKAAGAGWTVSGGSEGTDSLVSVERLQFADGVLGIAPARPYDFGGRGLADALWQNSAQGFLFRWALDGARIATQGAINGPGPGWTLAGTGDLNGDLAADLVWRHADGRLYAWLMGGGSLVGQGGIITLPGSQTVAAIADTDADGRSDIVVRGADGGWSVGRMNGTTLLSSGGGSLAANWQLAGAGDLNGDQRADLLWRNSATGEAYAWLMNGAAIIGQAALGNPGLAWSVAALADLSGDGRADMLWRNATTGQLWTWITSTTGLSVAASGAVGTPGAGWTLARAADFTGDDKADLLFAGPSGTTWLWTMDGAGIVGSQPGPTAGPGWVFL